ncbi:hypothetical protein [Lutibaculum baratangense]|uniref:Uncharacterized protein n=1 Tax=Lutibaculum baratangense AMV1 TaxID=631454 RepID=V4RQQ0_9HYPH|nr:hypothetical protein [Lutibaculum baratangense]ESR25450.1 hypothetical protein N177_1745 [Lutibaculum baratangense AMV1]
MIALIDEPPAAEGRVLAAWRRVYIEPGTIQASQIIGSLQQKYGDPGPKEPVREAETSMWREPSGNGCRDLYRWGQPQALASRWTDEGKDLALTAPDGTPMPGAIYPTVLTDPSDPRRNEALGCGPFLTANLNFDASRMQASGYGARGMDVVDQTLTDIGPYLEAFEASREILAEQLTSASEAAFDAPGGPDMVGLRLGMSIGEAEEIVRARLGDAARKFGATGVPHGTGGYADGSLYVAEDNRELIALLEDPAAPGRLVAVWRRIYAPAGTSAQAVLRDIKAKYGEPAWFDDGTGEYFFADAQAPSCEVAYRSVLAWRKTGRTLGRRHGWRAG